MNILLTIHHYLDPNAGASAVTLQLGQRYQQQGHQVHYFSFDNLPSWMPEPAKGIVFPEFVAAHLAHRRGQPFDVIETTTGDAWLWGQLLKSRHGKPLLAVQSHGLEQVCHEDRLEEARLGQLTLSWKYPFYHGGFRLWEVSRSLHCADLLFMLNAPEADYAIERMGLEAHRVHVMPNGIDEAFFDLELTPTPAADDTIAIAQLGSYILRKGIKYGVPALNQILQAFPNVRVSFLGTGCPESQVHQDFEPSVRSRIQVIPRYTLDQLPDLLKGHQIKLMPSLSEGFGLALVEAMACGLAPVATAIQGPKAIVNNGQDGLLVPPRNVEALVQALTKLIRDRDYLHQLRGAAQQTAQQYRWSHIAESRLQLYANLLDKRRLNP